MNKLVKFKTSKTIMYINTNHIITMNKLDSPIFYDDGVDPCTYGIILVNGMKLAIPTSCFEEICEIFCMDKTYVE